jgi:4-oxalocrotonate tautomerase
MPIITISLVEGRTPAQIRAMIQAVSDAAVTTLDAPLETINIVVNEVAASHWGAGDATVAELQAGS